MALIITIFSISILFASVYRIYLAILHHFRNSGLSLPPGPKGPPIIGSLFDALRNFKESGDGALQPQWARYIEMGKKYGSDIIYVNVLGSHAMILNSVKHTDELLEKRSALYSDRPAMHMTKDLVGWYWNFAVMRYSNWWRLHRRTFHQHFQAQAVAAYHPFIRQSTSTTLRKLTNSKTDENGVIQDVRFDELALAIQQHAGAIILRVTYGINSQEEIEHYSELAHAAAQGLIASVNHGSFFVDYFPLLKYVPAWLPGASFKSKANIWASFTSKLLNEPWKKLQTAMDSGITIPTCFATKNLEKFNVQLDSGTAASKEQVNMEEVIKNCSGIAYLAGADTTVSLLLSCMLALSYHPHVQEKAQKELDSVIKSSRLPDFGDRDKLPYVEAVFKETQRMFPVTPLAVPHCSTSEDIYTGYYIPKGTTIIANVGAILHDPELYENPLEFNPDRFMKECNSRLPPNPELYAFGFGRRICPGRYLALDSAWIVIACVLATCNISRPLHANMDQKIDIEADFIDGNIVHPKPFKCRIIPRSEAARALLNTGYPLEEN